MPIGRVIRTAYVALRHPYRTPVRTDAGSPGQLPDELLREQQFAVCTIEHVEESIAIRMQQKLSIFAAKLGVDEHVRFVRIPVAEIVGCELVIPLQLPVSRFERQHTIRI